MRKFIFVLLVISVVLGPSQIVAQHLVTFDDITSLDDLASLGITFSPNITIWSGGSYPSVLDDPDGGAISAPDGICAAGCYNGTGSIYFNTPQEKVSIYAFSGPGSDYLSSNVQIHAFDEFGNSLGVVAASDAVQYEKLTIIASGIRRLDLTCGNQGDGWDNLEFFAPIIPATVDINPNTLMRRSRGRWITCYIELLEGYDLADIDIASIKLNDVVPAETEPTGIGDYDEDGNPDLMVKFDRAEVIALLSPGEVVPVTVTGNVGDEQFSGTDYIRVISPPVYPPEDEDTSPPVKTASLEVHPNPFNPSVQIVYSIPNSSRVLIQVWDIQGRLVRTIEDVEKTQGTYRTEWHGKNESGRRVASGLYFCRLSVGSDVITKKLMLLR